MKRKYKELRQLILKQLFSGQQTINQLSINTNINWRTVALHLGFLAGKGYVKEIVSSGYVRIFELTDLGAQKIGSNKTKRIPAMMARVEINYSPERKVKIT